MKTTIYVLFCTIMFGACTQKKYQAETLLEDPTIQEDIFNAILTDSVYLEEFLNQMHSMYPPMHAKRGRMMKRMYRFSETDSLIMADSLIRKRMLRHMLNQADRDSVFCRQMSQSIIERKALRKRLRQHMNMPK